MSSRAYAMLLAAGADPRVRITGEGSGTISGSALAWTLLSQGLVEKEALSFYAQCALTANDPDLILAAVPQGLDPDLRPYEGTQADSDGETLLHLAAGQGSKGIADALMMSGADADLKTRSGKTAREIALQAGHTDVVETIDEWVQHDRSR